MEFLADYGLFLAKAVTLLACVMVVVSLIASVSHKTQKPHYGHIEVTKLNKLYKDMSETLKKAVFEPDVVKQQAKVEKKEVKQEKAKRKKSRKQGKDADAEAGKKRVYVLNFHGDIKAGDTYHLREEITTVLSVARPEDEVVVRLESAGGMVHGYGLAASQLQRIPKKGVPLTVCIDKVAASGGYMMACVADKILAAPFAIVGSIGVVGQLPNFHRLLKKHDVDFEMQTAGEYKRTLTMFAENTDKARQKFADELEDTHTLFKEFIHDNRQALDVDSVATGETWYGRRAVDNGLIDDVLTSDEYLSEQQSLADILEVRYVHKKTLPEKIGVATQGAMDRLLLTWWDRIQQSRFFS